MSGFEAQVRNMIGEIVRAEVARALAASKGNEGNLLTVKLAAKRLGMSASFVRAAVRDGRLPAVRVGRSVRVRESDVDALPARHRQPHQQSVVQRAEQVLGLALVRR